MSWPGEPRAITDRQLQTLSSIRRRHKRVLPVLD